MKDLSGMFNKFKEARPLFSNRHALAISFDPENIPHRDSQIESVGRMLAPALKGGKPSNLFVYGKTGTGKTMICKHVAKELVKASGGSSIKIIYVNCKMKQADTEYRLLAYLIKEMGGSVPFTGLPTDKLYQDFFGLLDQKEQTMIIIMDEIDSLIRKNGDGVLYILTRANQDLKKAKLSLIGITNDLGFINRLDPRVRSSLGEEELVFPPYNALQLRDILMERAKIGFVEKGVSQGVIEKCAAYAAQEHGDARRALDLLRVAGELAERTGFKQVETLHVDKAQDKIDQDRVIEIVKSQPRQSQLILLSIFRCSSGQKDLRQRRVPFVQTADIWNTYQNLCKQYRMKPLTQRRVSDLIAEYDLFGMINTKVISKGRYGRTRTVELSLDEEMQRKVKATLQEVFG